MSTPPERPRATRLALPLLAFLFGAVGLLMAIAVVFRPTGEPGSPTIGGAFRLIDQNGKPVTEAALKGGPSLVFFGFTHCPDVCPTTLYEMTQLYTALGPQGDRVKAFFVTVDPERDTPDLLKTYLSAFDPRITGLTGDRPAIDGIQKAYRVFARKVQNGAADYTMDHTALVYLMDAQGRFVNAFNLQRSAEESARELRKYL